MNHLFTLLAALTLTACGGGASSPSPVVRPVWSAEVDTLDTFELALRAKACPGPAVIDSTGFSGAHLARIELVAKDCGGEVV